MQVSLEIKPNTEVHILNNGMRFNLIAPTTIIVWMQGESNGIITFVYHDLTCEIYSDRAMYAVLGE